MAHESRTFERERKVSADERDSKNLNFLARAANNVVPSTQLSLRVHRITNRLDRAPMTLSCRADTVIVRVSKSVFVGRFGRGFHLFRVEEFQPPVLIFVRR